MNASSSIDDVLPEARYYFFGLFGNPDGTNYISVQTQWVGFESIRPIVEIRKARFVNPVQIIGVFEKLGFPIPVVNDLNGAATLLGFGGYAIVEQGIAERVFPFCVNAEPAVPRGMRGFEGRGDQYAEFERRAPSKKLRMRIFKRDNLRCKICGRSADSSSDIELHVHHITPVARGGGTVEHNLITLCMTCHGGLDPHYDLTLFRLIGESGNSSMDDWVRELLRKKIQYRTNCMAEWGGEAVR